MFKYVTGRKAPGELLESEDLLTSDFFGTASYLPGQLLLVPYLREVARLNPHATDFHRVVSRFEKDDVRIRFWPHFKLHQRRKERADVTLEPDVVVEAPGGPWLWGEAKFRSAIDVEQLGRELACGIQQCGVEDFYLLLISADLVRPRMGKESLPIETAVAHSAAASGLGDVAALKKHVVWVNWQAGTRLALDARPRIDALGLADHVAEPMWKLASDLGSVLVQRELAPFQLLEYARVIARRPDRNAAVWLDRKSAKWKRS